MYNGIMDQLNNQLEEMLEDGSIETGAHNLKILYRHLKRELKDQFGFTEDQCLRIFNKSEIRPPHQQELDEQKVSKFCHNIVQVMVQMVEAITIEYGRVIESQKDLEYQIVLDRAHTISLNFS